jgi:hypothetical protein
VGKRFFKKCKVLQGNAVLLHSGVRGGNGRGKAEVPGFIGRKLLKPGFRRVFKNSNNFFGWHLAVYGKALNSLQGR